MKYHRDAARMPWRYGIVSPAVSFVRSPRSFDLLRGYAVIKRWRVSRFNDIEAEIYARWSSNNVNGGLSLSLSRAAE